MTRSSQAQLVSLTPTLVPASYTSGQILFANAELAGAVFQVGRVGELRSIAGHDLSDSGIAIDLVFSSATTVLGAVGAAPSIADADLKTFDAQGHVSLATGDWLDVGGARILRVGGTDTRLPLMLQPAESSRSVYVTGIARGSITVASASDLFFNFGFKWW